MKTSLLLLAALSIAILVHVSRHTHASELSQLLNMEIQDLNDEIEKRGKKRKPCGFTWFCKRRRGRRGKRVSEISIYLFPTYGYITLCIYHTKRTNIIFSLCRHVNVMSLCRKCEPGFTSVNKV